MIAASAVPPTRAAAEGQHGSAQAGQLALAPQEDQPEGEVEDGGSEQVEVGLGMAAEELKRHHRGQAGGRTAAWAPAPPARP